MNKLRIQEIEKLILDPTFRAWCMGEEGTDNALYWEKWINENSYQQEEGMLARSIVLQLEENPKSVPDNRKYETWQEIADRIKNETAGNKIVRGAAPVRHRREGWKYTAAAAIILLLLCFSVVYLTYPGTSIKVGETQKPPKEQVVSTGYGEKKIITLNNGTKIILNAHSSLTYWDGWSYNKKVRVKLKGEAYFAVTERTSSDDPPFQVKTQDGFINVMGTRFDVSTWEKETSVVLKKGRVTITRGAIEKDKPDAILKPNQRAKFNKDIPQIDISSVNPEVYISWIKNFFRFDHTPLLKIVQRIEHTFGVKVIIKDSSLKKRKLSGSIESQNLEVVISALSKILQVPVTYTDGEVLIGSSHARTYSY